MRQGFSLNSAHYLIKPVKDEDFAQAMANCRLGRALQVPTLAVTVEGRTLEVDTRQIRYLEVQQRSVVLHTTRGDLPLAAFPPRPPRWSGTGGFSCVSRECW